jgi:hydrogenase nickel incorporation protein HypA/HybF
MTPADHDRSVGGTLRRQANAGDGAVHELSITQSVVDTVAERLGGQRVERVTVVVGKLSGVVPDAMMFCFDLCTTGTPLEGARLEIVEVPGEGRCRTCGADVELEDFIALCPCGSADLAITGGEQLTIKDVEVAV